nr:hypothetical protein [Tanacetum cinerariifolium]
MFKGLGYIDRRLLFTHFRIPGESLDVERQMMERMTSKGKGAVIEKIVDHNVNDVVVKELMEKRLSDKFEFKKLLAEIDHEFGLDNSSQDSLEFLNLVDFDDVDFEQGIEELMYYDTDDDDPYHLVDEPQEPEEISDVFAKLDQTLDKLARVIEAEEPEEIIDLYANYDQGLMMKGYLKKLLQKRSLMVIIVLKARLKASLGSKAQVLGIFSDRGSAHAQGSQTAHSLGILSLEPRRA